MNTNGVITTFHANGKKHKEETYKNGKLDGLVISYHDNGQLDSEGTYKNGKAEGLHTFWD